MHGDRRIPLPLPKGKEESAASKQAKVLLSLHCLLGFEGRVRDPDPPDWGFDVPASWGG